MTLRREFFALFTGKALDKTRFARRYRFSIKHKADLLALFHSRALSSAPYAGIYLSRTNRLQWKLLNGLVIFQTNISPLREKKISTGILFLLFSQIEFAIHWTDVSPRELILESREITMKYTTTLDYRGHGKCESNNSIS